MQAMYNLQFKMAGGSNLWHMKTFDHVTGSMKWSFYEKNSTKTSKLSSYAMVFLLLWAHLETNTNFTIDFALEAEI